MNYFRKLSDIIVLLITIPTLTVAESFINKGTISISGEMSYKKIDTKQSKSVVTKFSISPGISYFILPSIAIGIKYIYRIDQYDYPESYPSDSKDVIIINELSPEIRYYFTQNKLAPFSLISFTKYFFNTKKYIDSDIYDLNKISSNTITIGIGVDYFLTKQIAIEPRITYSFSKEYNRYIGWKENTTLETGFRLNVFF
ncbi:MAG: hypothetical protein IIB44_00895 [Candidatus Marinimicrobia bacterium]|nr:hypothetical protein [Candidatus Neomarinimicrobiota bacterium]